MVRFIAVLPIISVLSLVGMVPSALTWSQTLQVGVPPSGSAIRVEERFTDFAQGLGEHLGVKVVLRSRSDFASFHQALERETFEIAFVQPVDYVRLRREGTSYRVFGRFGNTLAAAFAVRDPEIKTLNDLRGETLAFPPPSAAATILGLMALESLGYSENDFDIKYYSDHQSCVQAMLIGSAKACVTIDEVLELIMRDRPLDVRIVFETQPITNSAIVVRGDYWQRREELIEYLRIFNQSEGGQELFNAFRIDGFYPASDADYESVEELLNTQITRFESRQKIHSSALPQE